MYIYTCTYICPQPRLITAPMPYSYWGEQWPDFPRITPTKSNKAYLLNDTKHIQ